MKPPVPVRVVGKSLELGGGWPIRDVLVKADVPFHRSPTARDRWLVPARVGEQVLAALEVSGWAVQVQL